MFCKFRPAVFIYQWQYLIITESKILILLRLLIVLFCFSKIFQSIITCIESKNYSQIRNALIVLTKVSERNKKLVPYLILIWCILFHCLSLNNFCGQVVRASASDAVECSYVCACMSAHVCVYVSARIYVYVCVCVY